MWPGLSRVSFRQECFRDIVWIFPSFFGIARSFGGKLHVPNMVLLRCQVYIGVEAEKAMDFSEAAFARPP